MASKEVKKHLINEYKDALERSPVWIKVAFKAFLQFPNEFILNRPFLYFVLGKGTVSFKMGKNTAEYGLSKVRNEYCSNCIYSFKNIVEEKDICSHVKGDINPRRWCKLWKGKKQ